MTDDSQKANWPMLIDMPVRRERQGGCCAAEGSDTATAAESHMGQESEGLRTPGVVNDT